VSDDTYTDEDGRVRRREPEDQKIKEIIANELAKAEAEEN
jgi:hypothetical protein